MGSEKEYAECEVTNGPPNKTRRTSQKSGKPEREQSWARNNRVREIEKFKVYIARIMSWKLPMVPNERECLMELLLRLRLLLLQLVSIGPPKEKEYFCKKSNSRKLAF